MTIRVFREVIVVMILVAGGAPGDEPQTAAPPTSRAVFELVRQLHLQTESLYGQGRFEEALAVAERALALSERALDPRDPDVAESLNNLAALHAAQGNYARAEPLYLRALAIREEVRGSTHPDVAQSLNNLATLYWELGEHGKAAPLLVRAVDIVERTLDPGHPLSTLIVSNLALLWRDEGAYANAEQLLIRVRDLRERAFGHLHPLVAQSLNSLAAIYHAEGAYADAEALYLEAKDIAQQTGGPGYLELATYSSNLATLYRDRGAYATAEPLYCHAIEIFERTLGSHPRIADSLNNLATLYREQGAYAKAEAVLVRALDIRTRAFGDGNLDVANSLNNLAMQYREQGKYAEAERRYLRALEIREAQLGQDHPDVAHTLNGLAELHWAQGAYDRAEPYLARAAEIREQQLRAEFAQLPEPRKRAMMALLQQETDAVVSFHAGFAPSSASALALAFTTVLRRKLRILGARTDSELRLRSDLAPLLGGQLEQLIRARSELVARRYASVGSRDAAHDSAAAATQARIIKLESRLSAASPDVRAQLEPVTLARVQAALPAGAALVEFVRYEHRDPGQPRQSRRGSYYGAYLLTARDAPQWVALGAAAPIDVAVDDVASKLSALASGESAAALRRLDALVLAPIRPRLPGTSHLILAPDSKLNLVPFEALLDPDHHYAIESYLESYVMTGRDLLRVMTPRSPRSPAILVAAPDYGPWFPPRPDKMVFAGLPGASTEAEVLQRYFPTPRLTSGMATKSALAALTGPALLHIATHGFYARDARPVVSSAEGAPFAWTMTSRAPSEATRGMFVDAGSLPRSRRPFDDMAYALDHSGLAMAGANQGEGGIVTAREIAGFDWRDTQLVVLSACGTGAGAVPSGDGVYSLRRALVLAGVASQVVSLWSIDDEATWVLMREYYDRLARGLGRAEALRQAKLHLLHLPRFHHPYYWAAFIAAGDWRSLAPGTLLSPEQP